MLIGLHGAAGSGKDQSYTYLRQWAEAKNRPIRRDAFADLLKLSAARALGYQGDLAQCVAICNEIKQPGWEIIVREPGHKVEHAITGRQFLEFYGDEAHRQTFGQDFWIDAVMTRHIPSEILVLTDVRYPNEARAIRARGGQVWKLVRPGVRLVERELFQTPLPPELVDRVIDNDRGLKKLRKHIRAAAKYQAAKALNQEPYCRPRPTL